MAYVSVNAPLPPNSTDMQSPSCTAFNQSVVDGVETAVANAKAASAQIATPASFSTLGQGVVNDVARGQNELISAQSMAAKPPGFGSKQSQRRAMLNAPVQVPLNVPVEQFSGCSVRGVDGLLPMKVAPPKVSDNMPPAAPTDTQLLYQGSVFRSGGPLAPLPNPGPSRFASIVPNSALPGLGAIPWGDAIAMPLPPAAGMRGKGLLWLALGGLGLYAVTRKKGRR